MLRQKPTQFCRKTCWKEQPLIFTVYLMNHIVQTSVLLNVIIECIELNWLCKHLKKIRSIQATILVLNWAKQSLFLWVSLKWIWLIRGKKIATIVRPIKAPILSFVNKHISIRSNQRQPLLIWEIYSYLDVLSTVPPFQQGDLHNLQ